MFGLGDNKDQTANYNNISAGVATQPMPGPQIPLTPGPTSTSMPGFDSASTTPPAPDPLSIPTAPPVPDSPTSDTVPLTPPAPDPMMPEPQPAPAPPPPPPEPAGPTLNLEHAYIASDPPNMTDQTGSASTKPTAASLFTSSNDDLVKMKQKALQSLEPLVDKLEQTPEEKFKTTMMLIQASDNSNLLNDAYDAANDIKDEKARAQALLDVVNEINYFTQQTHSTTQSQAPNAGQVL